MHKPATRILIDCLAGIAGGVASLFFVIPGMAQDQPPSLTLVVLSFAFGRLAVLVPIGLILLGVVLGVIAGRLAGWAMR
jgi:hypothetical protein